MSLETCSVGFKPDSLTDISVEFKLNQTYTEVGDLSLNSLIRHTEVGISEHTNIKNCKGDLLCPLRLVPDSLSDVSVVKLRDKLG